MVDTTILQWLTAGLLGAAVGIAELTSRYRDEPDNALRSLPAYIYLLLNALAAAGALGLMQTFHWTLGISDPGAAGWAQVLVAGFGAMAVLRTSLFTLKVGDETVSIGPVRFLEILLNAVDSGVDRKRGQVRARVVGEVMSAIDFDRAYQALPTYCFALMQNLPQKDQDQIGRQIGLLRSASMELRTKSLILGLLLMNLVGENVLKAAVSSLGADIHPAPTTSPEAPDA
jgi:hypothetical protein